MIEDIVAGGNLVVVSGNDKAGVPALWIVVGNIEAVEANVATCGILYFDAMSRTIPRSMHKVVHNIYPGGVLDSDGIGSFGFRFNAVDIRKPVGRDIYD